MTAASGSIQATFGADGVTVLGVELAELEVASAGGSALALECLFCSCLALASCLISSIVLKRLLGPVVSLLLLDS